MSLRHRQPVYCDEARMLFAAFTAAPTPQRRLLCDQLIRRLKRQDIWSKLDCLYIFAAADSQAALINWKNPGTFNAALVNAPSFTADRGFTGNGTTSYVNSTFTPSTAGGLYTQNSSHVSARSLTSAAAADSQRLVGVGNSATVAVQLRPRGASDLYGLQMQQAAINAVANADSSGHFVGNRSASNAIQHYRNGASLGTGTNASTGLPNDAVHFDHSFTSFATLQVASGSIGSSLSAEEAAAFYAIELAYMQAVGAV
jgi:hypothetical protein